MMYQDLFGFMVTEFFNPGITFLEWSFAYLAEWTGFRVSLIIRAGNAQFENSGLKFLVATLGDQIGLGFWGHKVICWIIAMLAFLSETMGSKWL